MNYELIRCAKIQNAACSHPILIDNVNLAIKITKFDLKFSAFAVFLPFTEPSTAKTGDDPLLADSNISFVHY